MKITDIITNEAIDLEPLYHASLRAFEPEIRTQGLRPGGDTRLFAWSDPRYVYLTPDPGVAMSFISSGVIEPNRDIDDLLDQGGVLFTIDQNQLDQDKLDPDPHWNTDPDQGDESYGYRGRVPPRAIVGRKYFDIE